MHACYALCSLQAYGFLRHPGQNRHPRNSSCVSGRSLPAALSPTTITMNPALPVSFPRMWRSGKRRSRKASKVSGNAMFCVYTSPKDLTHLPGRSHAGNSSRASTSSPESSSSKTIFEFRTISCKAMRFSGAQLSLFYSGDIFMKLKAIAFAFAAILFATLSAHAATTIAPCCDGGICCDGGSCCK